MADSTKPEANQMIGFRLPKHITRQVRVNAARRGIRQSTYLAQILTDYFARKGGSQPSEAASSN